MRRIWRCVAAALAGLCANLPAMAQQDELRFPGDQFDRPMYTPNQATGNRVYESILMDMRDANFEPLSAYDPSDEVRRMAEPVGLLKVLMTSNDYITCTASIIDTDLILTNWHCLPKFGTQVSKAALQMGFYSADGRGVQVYPVNTRPVESDRVLDYAILRVTGDLSKWGRVQLSTVDPPPNRSLEIIHHPAGQPKQVTRRSCRSNDPSIVSGELRHKCDTLAGSSGAPVFFGGKAAALHFAGVPQSRLGVDPSFETNLAIPISRIAEKSAVVKRLTAAAVAAAPAPATPTSVVPAAGSAAAPPFSAPTILTFETMTASSDRLDLEIPPCSLNRSTLECGLWVTAKNERYPWYFNDKSHVLDENGGTIPVSSMTIGGQTRTTSGWGYKVEWIDLAPGVRTRIVYRFTGVRDPAKLQALVVSLLYNEFATIRWSS